MLNMFVGHRQIFRSHNRANTVQRQASLKQYSKKCVTHRKQLQSEMISSIQASFRKQPDFAS